MRTGRLAASSFFNTISRRDGSGQARDGACDVKSNGRSWRPASSGKDENTVLTPIIPMTLERAIEFIREGEIVEVTPENIRLRKVLLSATGRHTARTPKA